MKKETGNGKRETGAAAVVYRQSWGSPAHYRLRAWKNAMVLVKKVFEATANIPARDRYTLAAQMRRSAISVPSNIAEGAARGSNAEYARFLLRNL